MKKNKYEISGRLGTIPTRSRKNKKKAFNPTWVFPKKILKK
jgi:hypothetical protein